MAHLLLAISSSVLIGRALNREIGSEDACSVLIYGVLDERYFFSCILFLFVCLLTLGLTALSFEQLGNIAFNMTTNERINRSRYSWMTDEEGRPSNKFDRGVIRNILEFWRVPGYAVDYMNVFAAPGSESDETERSSLTHENVMRLTTPPRGSLTASNSGSSTGANFTVRKNSLNQRQLGASLNATEGNQDQPIPATTSPATSTWPGGVKDNDSNFTNITGNPNPPNHITSVDSGSPNRYAAKQKSNGSNRLMQMSTTGAKSPASSSNVEMTQVRQRADSVDSNSELGDLMV